MDITKKTVDQVVVVEISGEIDGKTAPTVLSELAQICQPSIKIILDMSKVVYMSSAGLRVLLMVYRQVIGLNGQMVLVALSPEINDTLSETGFLSYFTTRATLAEGMAALQQDTEDRNDNVSDKLRPYRSASDSHLR